MITVHLQRGEGPILLAQAHAGRQIPAAIRARLNDNGHALADTDWHIERLYDGLLEDATVVRATLHRYAIDVNRDPRGVALYPDMNSTGLCPLTDFDGRPLYKPGQEPSRDEIESRRRDYHAPYHEALAAELDRIRQCHGVALVYDCHSIRSRIPFLFEGTLPDFNIGTYDGRSAAPAIERLAACHCRAAAGYTTIVNGRFKGGWTTRHYGDPAAAVHAIQMEIAQRAYMEEAPPWRYLPDRAEALRGHLKTLLEALRSWALSADRPAT